MAEHSHPDGIESGHELRDLSARNIALFGAGLAVAIAVTLLTVYGLMTLLRAREARQAGPPTVFTIAPEPTPGPHLLVEPGRAIKNMRAQEEARLNSYGWIDEENGIIHIPIERAMDILAKQGLPARQGKAQARESKAAAPAASGRSEVRQ
jgi:hypothetical protein